MSNAPFKIAFWVMGLAFCLTVVLTALKPEEIRLAMISRRTAENRSVAADTESQASLPLADQRAMSSESATTTEFMAENVQQPTRSIPAIVTDAQGTSPIRVASANLDAQWSQSGPPSIIEATTPATPFDSPSVTAKTTEAEIEILVPEPIPSPTPATPNDMSTEVNELRREVLRFQLAEARREFDTVRRDYNRQEVEQVEQELAELKQQIAELRDKRLTLNLQSQTADEVENPPIAPIPDPRFLAQQLIAQASQETLQRSKEESQPTKIALEPVIATNEPDTKTVRTIEVTPGKTSSTYSFLFEDAAIQDVLKSVAERAGWKIVIEPEIDGEFSGRFEQVDPQQAFAAIIKSKGFGLSFRGDYVLVRSHKDARIR